MPPRARKCRLVASGVVASQITMGNNDLPSVLIHSIAVTIVGFTPVSR